eukprot:CAMPEP_0197005064 /NCGR_PEP_ID=MMETSP1380-20130617/27485_1 /TAXON_ID=5936 /ORGANISM="Euplotes crassus, Strain CT5" /LENGTH=118 /DNA_ID=CAMNT_0042424065 /DNA_START=51 /DNA_END=404 /DNA_ORIENTATION=-
MAAVLTIQEDIGSFDKPMENLFMALEKNAGIPSELPLKYLTSIVFACLIGVILGAVQILIGVRSGGFFTLIFFSFLCLVRDFPGWHKDEAVIEIQTIKTFKDIAVIGTLIMLTNASSS